jgi:hypothetical protein
MSLFGAGDTNPDGTMCRNTIFQGYSMPTSTCLNCGASEMDRPLIALKFQQQELQICPQCLPILIHKPYQLVEKLPGFTPSESSPPDDH